MTEQPPEKMVQQMVIRVPLDIKRWLEREARRNLSSQASEIIRALRIRMEERQSAARDAAAA
jgi:hypothetical protein